LVFAVAPLTRVSLLSPALFYEAYTPQASIISVQPAGLFDPEPVGTAPLARFAAGISLLAAEARAVGQVTADIRVLGAAGKTVLVGLYDPLGGERLAGVDDAGEPLMEGAVRVGVE
jgi:hypothetical protein